MLAVLLLAASGVVALLGNPAPAGGEPPVTAGAGSGQWYDAEAGVALAYDAANDRIVMYGELDGGPRGITWIYDLEQNRWSRMSDPEPPPTSRRGQATEFATSIQKTVLFGGNDGALKGDTWTYDLGFGEWWPSFPATPPSPRMRHAMAYDSESDRIVLFGGQTATGISAETWAYDPVGVSWTNMAPPAAPTARYFHAMAYDAAKDVVVLHGGVAPDGISGETWEFDLNGNAWTNTTAGGGPGTRYGAAAAYDPTGPRVMLFGGHNGDNFAAGTYAYDSAANTWLDRAPSSPPAGRYGHGMARDSGSAAIVLFGGQTAAGRNAETWSYTYATNSWSLKAATQRPSPRYGHAMAYDSGSQVAIVFGGSAPGNNNETWAYSPLSQTWRRMSPASAPSTRTQHAMAYDSQSDRVILFGGNALGGNGETWAYDYNTNAWTNMNPAGAPVARYLHAMTYNTSSDRVVLFGGVAGGARNDETWEYNFDSNNWLRRWPTSRPSARSDHAMAYDSESGRVVLFGGLTGGGAGTTDGQTWMFNGATNNWTQDATGTAPLAQASSVMAYDTQSDRTVLIGQSGILWSASTWTYDVNTGTWAQRVPATAPLRRNDGGAAAAYVPGFDLVLHFGGLISPATDMLWSFDANTDTWVEIMPRGGPPARESAAMAYDISSDRTVLFGGASLSAGTLPSDTRLFDDATGTWTKVDSYVRPGPRDGAAMAYDSQSDRTVMFGGYDVVNFADTWAFDTDGTGWVNKNPVSAPAGRRFSAMAYDSGSDRMVLFGGDVGSTETWMYDLDSNTWLNLVPPVGPSGRSGHAMAYDIQSDRVILFGGTSGAGSVGDTWAYDIDSNSWMQTFPASKPSARTRASMAYDSASDRVVLFGGYRAAGGVSAETWAYDYESNNWTLVPTHFKPSRRGYSAVAYDSVSDRLVLVGGRDFWDDRADTWTFDLEAPHQVDFVPTAVVIGLSVAVPAVIVVFRSRIPATRARH